MYIKGQLLGAQFESAASDLTPTSTGLVYFNTSTAFIKYYNGSSWKTVVDTNSVQTIINKVLGTFGGPADLQIFVQDTEFIVYDSMGTNRAIRFDSVMPADNTVARYKASQTLTTGIGFVDLEIVDTTTVQTVLEKRTPIVRGSSAASGTLELRSTEHATKGYVHVTDGSQLLFGESDFTSLMSSVGPGTPVFAFDQSGEGNLVLTADNSGTCFIPAWNSAGSYASPTSVLSGDDLFQIAVRSFATATAQNFVDGQKAVCSIGVYAAENHSTTNLGTGFFISASLNGSTPRRRRIEFDGTGQILLGDSAPASGVNLKWVLDGAGDVGALSASRPNNIYAKIALVATSQGLVQFYDSTNTNYMAFKAPAAVTTSRTFTLPDGDGTAGQVLTTDGSQVLSWTTPSGSGSGDVEGFAGDWLNADGTTKVINHALVSTDVDVTIIDLSDNQIIGVDTITVTDANNITLTASEAPATTWRVVVQAKP